MLCRHCTGLEGKSYSLCVVFSEGWKAWLHLHRPCGAQAGMSSGACSVPEKTPEVWC